MQCTKELRISIGAPLAEQYPECSTSALPKKLIEAKFNNVSLEISRDECSGVLWLAYKINFELKLISIIHFSDNAIATEDFSFIIKYFQSKYVGYTINFYSQQEVFFYRDGYSYNYTMRINFEELIKNYHNVNYFYEPILAFCQLSNHLDIFDLESFNNILDDYKKSGIKKNFIFLNNRVDWVRKRIFDELKREKLLSNGYVSYLNTIRGPAAEKLTLEELAKSEPRIFNRQNDYFLEKPYRNFKDSHYLDSMTDNPRKFVMYYPKHSALFDFSAETFLIFTTLSSVNNNTLYFLTEKSYKGYIWGKIPVILGNTNNTCLMQHIFGFDTFRDIVNYAYDKEPNTVKKIDLYIQEVKRLASLDITKIPNLTERLMNNRKVMMDLVKDCNHLMERISNMIVNTVK